MEEKILAMDDEHGSNEEEVGEPDV